MSRQAPNIHADVTAIRRLATVILVGLAAVYVITLMVLDPSPAVLWIRAMSEAGMVGGLADWFAVEALFRHPLRLPIPHTALLPRNKSRAARNIARFIDDNFLVWDRITQQTQHWRPLRRVAVVLSHKQVAQRVADEFKLVAQTVFAGPVQGQLTDELTRQLADILSSSLRPRDIVQAIDILAQGSDRAKIITEIVTQVRHVVEDNRDSLTKLVQDNSRWWIAAPIDRQVVRVMMAGLLSVLDDLRDETSPARRDFDAKLDHFLAQLQTNGTLNAYLQTGLDRYLASDSFRATLAQLVGHVVGTQFGHIADTAAEQPADRQMLARLIQQAAHAIVRDQALEERLHQRLLAIFAPMVDSARPVLRAYIEQVVVSWDQDDFIYTIEQQVGRDLQFIRINGAVLGAMIGGVLFFMEHLIAP